ncbi:MAG: UTP--glucose-1-phosphate uridylyltransferase [Clostridia bacterium]|nr:UTP--glucose-1-phosphate uridylyltransferase [Clostridia bacterium]
MKVSKAVIPCGGFGTRFLPATKVIPKELMPIVDKPALWYIVEEVASAGITDVLIIIADGKEGVKNLFADNDRLNDHLQNKGQNDLYELANHDFGVKVSFKVQQSQKGSGDAVLLAKDFACGQPIAVLFGDDVIYTGDNDSAIKQLVDAHEITGKTVVGVQRTTEEVARRCGVMETVGKVGKITEINGIIEKPTGTLPSELVSLGRFIVTPEVFDALENTALSKDGEIYLTDAITKVAKDKGAVACLFEGRRYDIGNKQGYLEAVVDYALRDEKLGKDFAEYLKTKV